MADNNSSFIQVAIVLIVVVFGGFWLLSFAGMIVYGVLLIIAFGIIAFPFYYFANLSSKAKLRQFERLETFEREFTVAGVTYRWIKDAPIQFRPNLSLVVEVRPTRLPLNVAACDDKFVILGFIHLKVWGPYSCDLVAKVADERGENLYYDKTSDLKATHLVHGFEKKCGHVKSAMKFIESKANVSRFYFRRVPTVKEKIENLDPFHLSVKLPRGFEWSAFPEIPGSCLELRKDYGSGFDKIVNCYARIVKRDSSLILQTPKLPSEYELREDEGVPSPTNAFEKDLPYDTLKDALQETFENLNLDQKWTFRFKDYYR